MSENVLYESADNNPSNIERQEIKQNELGERNRNWLVGKLVELIHKDPFIKAMIIAKSYEDAQDGDKVETVMRVGSVALLVGVTNALIALGGSPELASGLAAGEVAVLETIAVIMNRLEFKDKIK